MSTPASQRELLQSALIEIRALKAALAEERARARANEPVAIVGLGCRFPGAPTPAAFLQLLRDGVDATGPAPEGRWPASAAMLPGGYLPDISGFDAELFGIAPRELLRMDPQQRLALEVAWETFENAGIAPDRLTGSATGVYLGIMAPEYGGRQMRQPGGPDGYTLTGNDLSFAAGRLAYQFGLQGPAMSVATACSSSLVAVHLACQALRAGECELALAGGVNLIVDPVTTHMLRELHALSPDGRCKTFSAAADGYGRGEGCGLVLLERESEARRHGHRILALVRGSAVNHDGPSAGITVPNGPAQEKLLRQAWRAAAIEPAELGYLEAHGTGTALGDPIEAHAIARALGGGLTEPLRLGSVKTNFGHLEAAAGAAGLLKLVLGLQQRQFFPHLHASTLSPHIPWRELPLRLVTGIEAWPASAGPRLGGVSSFGISGVNAHVVVQEAAPESPDPAATAGPAQLRLSAQTAEALRQQAGVLAAYLEAPPALNLADVAFTLAEGRAQLPRAAEFTATSVPDAVATLRALAAGRTPAPVANGAAPAAGRRISLPTYPFQRQPYWILGGEANVSNTPAATAAAVETTLAALVARVLGRAEPPPPQQPLLDAGLDSLMALEIQAWIQTAHAVTIPLERLLGGASLEEMEAQLGATPSPPAVPEAPLTAASSEALSVGQEAMWFLHQSAPDSSAYNVGVALRLPPGTHPPAMRRALEAVVARHAALRAVYPSRQGVPSAALPEKPLVAWEQTAAVADSDLAMLVETSYRRSFDLEHGPVVRAHWFEDAASGPVLLLVVHHIACDAISFQVLLTDLARAYEALARGEVMRTAPPPASYATFVAWQRRWMAGPRGARALEYWRQRLAGAPPALELATDYPRPAVFQFHGGSETVAIPPPLAAALRGLAQQLRATPFVLLLSAFYVLLRRYSGQDDLIVGSAVAARPPEFAQTVGYFVNPLPLRANLATDPAFSALVEQVRASVTAALEHQHLPFATLVEHLRLPRDPSRTPLFQVDFAWLKSPTMAEGAGAWRQFRFAEEEGQFDLGLHGLEDGDAWTATLKYNSDLFSPATASAMAAHLLDILEHAAAAPEEPASALGLTPAASGTWLAAGRGQRIAWGPQPLTRRLEQQARTSPESLAVEMFAGDDDAPAPLTFAALERWANQLARHLRQLGAGRGTRVGVLLERSLALPVALLASLKSGGVFVPMDPQYPPERLRAMVADSGMALLISTPALAERVAPLPPGIVVVAPESGASQTGEPLETAPDLSDPAYMIYTSGSTGTPKGAILSHRGLLNYTAWSRATYFQHGEAVPLHGSIGFDATLTSIFPPLLAGRRILVLPEAANSLDALRACLSTGPCFSLLKLTPAHLEALGALLSPEEIAASAHTLVVGGEALTGAVARLWRQHAPQLRIFNEYGPTEAVVGCCVYELGAEVSDLVPIGTPIVNTDLYVMDTAGRPLPPGAPGELCIAGDGVGLGYWNRAELSAQRFVTDPLHLERKTYRSGDVARWGPRGLEFLGRADDQVKLRGHRIELGEIESALRQQPPVREAAVVLRAEPGREPYLAAYVTLQEGEAAPVLESELRHALARRLPAVMVPTRVMALAHLPLTANGKLDRRALPAPAAPAAGAAEASSAAPRDALELRLAALWERLLDAAPIGIHTNFFDAGGHSLLAVRMMAALQDDFGELKLATLLAAPTIAELARALRERAAPAATAWVPLHAGGHRPPLFCVPGAGGNAIYLQGLARALGPDQPVFGLQGQGIENEAPPHTSVEAMAVYAESAWRALGVPGPVHLAGHSLGGWVIAELAHRLHAAGVPVGRLIVIDTPAPAYALPPSAGRAQWDQARWIAELTDRIAQLLHPGLRLDDATLRALAPAQQLEAFRAALVAAGLYPPEGTAAALAGVVRVFTAHSQIQYTLPERRLPGRLLLARTPQPLGPNPITDPAWGWAAAADTRVAIVPGEHLSVLRPPYVEELARHVRAFLEES